MFFGFFKDAFIILVFAIGIRFLITHDLVPRWAVLVAVPAMLIAYGVWASRRHQLAQKIQPISFRTFFLEEEEAYFVKCMREYCATRIDRGFTLVEENHHWSVKTADGSGGGLMNLAQLCLSHPREEWPRLIDGHFKALEVSETQKVTRGNEARVYEKVAERLMVRIDCVSKMYPGLKIPGRTALDDLFEYIVIDYPENIESLAENLLQIWNKSLDEVFLKALANTARDAPFPFTKEEVEGAPVYFVCNDSFYTATHWRFLDRYPESAGKFGRIFALPNRHTLMYIPVENRDAIAAFHRMIQFIQTRYLNGPGSITPTVYWEKDGTVLAIPSTARIDEKQNIIGLSVFPPDEFWKWVRALPGTRNDIEGFPQ